MEKVTNIDVENIMQKIRNEIKEKGYTNDMLSFNDIEIDISDLIVNEFNMYDFNEEIKLLNRLWNVKANRPIIDKGTWKSKITKFMKKVIRKSIKFYVEPIATDQAIFNAMIVKTFNMLSHYLRENNNDELNEKLEQALYEQEAMKREIEELKKQIKIR